MHICRALFGPRRALRLHAIEFVFFFFLSFIHSIFSFYSVFIPFFSHSLSLCRSLARALSIICLVFLCFVSQLSIESKPTTDRGNTPCTKRELGLWDAFGFLVGSFYFYSIYLYYFHTVPNRDIHLMMKTTTRSTISSDNDDV